MTLILRFDEPTFLYLLFSVPLVIFTHLYFMHHAKRKALLFGNFTTIERITGKKILTKNILQLVLRALVLTCLIISAAGPILWQDTRESASDVIIVIDASASMAATDMDGPRIDAAREAALTFVNQLDTAAEIGVVQFSGLANVLQAPTRDRDAVTSALREVELQSVGGTDLSGAIVTGANLLSTSNRGRVIVLLTDGVASVSLYDTNPLERSLRYARDQRVVVHTIGVGSQPNAPFIPSLSDEARTFNEQNLKTIAESTGGTYSWARDRTQLSQAYATIGTEGSTGLSSTELRLGFLFLAIVILFIEWGLANTRYRLLP